jgi:hypothetical protein
MEGVVEHSELVVLGQCHLGHPFGREVLCSSDHSGHCCDWVRVREGCWGSEGQVVKVDSRLLVLCCCVKKKREETDDYQWYLYATEEVYPL